MSEASRKALKSSLERLAEEYEKTSKMVGGFADSAKARSDKSIKAYNAGIPSKIQEKLSIRDEISRNRKMNEHFQEESKSPRAMAWPHIKENMESGVIGTAGNIKIHSAKLKSIEDGISAESRQVNSLYAASRSSEKNKKIVDAGLSDTRGRIASLNSEGRSSWSQQKDATRGGQK
jgi:hypothetical protein